ncbi:MAG: cytochrome c [Sumerlaeia bacterium]
MRSLRWNLVLLALATAVCACNNMTDQERVEAYEPSPVFANRQSARPAIPGTVARGQLNIDVAFYTGFRPGVSPGMRTAAQRVDPEGDNPAGPLATYDRSLYVDHIPTTVTLGLVLRGQERYNIFCAPCHGPAGHGDGMIVQRGFSPPASFHIERLREDPDGRLFDVITNGYGNMYSYASRVPPADRWAIVAYVRALQTSQSVSAEALPRDVRAKLADASGGGEEAGS